MPDEFRSDETLLISYKTSSFYLFVVLVKLMIFNAMKSKLDWLKSCRLGGPKGIAGFTEDSVLDSRHG